MQKRTTFKILIIGITMILFTVTGLSAKDVDLRGMVRSYTGFRFSEQDIAVNEQTIDLTLEGWGDMTRLVINPYAYVGTSSEPELGIREAYVDIFFDNADLRVGKQAIIWGQAEGAFITDIVSPRDMRSFILADFREIRKGVPAVKADYYAGSYTFEGIWIPRFVPTSMPGKDSMWMQDMDLKPGVTITPQPVDQPAFDLKNSEIFGKMQYFGPRISWEVMGGYAWTDTPYISSLTPTGPSTVDANQAYGRYKVVGGSLSTAIGPVVLRSEAAVYLDKPFSVITLGSPPSIDVENHHQVQALAGLDWGLWGIEMSAQYILSYIHDFKDGMIEQGKMLSEFDHTFTFRVVDTFLDDRLTAKVFVYFEADPLNALIRPSLTWSIEDGVLIEGGVELFVGSEGTFGSYKDNSLAFVALRWYF